MGPSFDISDGSRADLIIGVESTLSAAKASEIKSELRRIPGVFDVTIVPGLKGAYCIKR